MYTLTQLQHTAEQVSTEINGKWVACRPLGGPFLYRFFDAWAVLTGKADAFTWPEGQ